MALRCIFGILKRTILGAFRHPQTFMQEIMRALCTMNLNVSMNAEVRIPAHLSFYLAGYD